MNSSAFRRSTAAERPALCCLPPLALSVSPHRCERLCRAPHRPYSMEALARSKKVTGRECSGEYPVVFWAKVRTAKVRTGGTTGHYGWDAQALAGAMCSARDDVHRVEPCMANATADDGLSGNPSSLSGNPSSLSGNPSSLSGNPSSLSGNPSSLSGNPSSLSGNPSSLSGNPSRLR